jgi:tRNA(Ile)-lysidine synthetase-like protein
MISHESNKNHNPTGDHGTAHLQHLFCTSLMLTAIQSYYLQQCSVRYVVPQVVNQFSRRLLIPSNIKSFMQYSSATHRTLDQAKNCVANNANSNTIKQSNVRKLCKTVQFISTMNSLELSKYGFEQNSSIAIAYSGGVDSTALFALLCEYIVQTGHKGSLHVLQVNHHLRSESTNETLQAKELITQYIADKPYKNQIHHIILDIDWPKEEKPLKGKIQSSARYHRHELLHSYCKANRIQFLCYAHQLNDTIETVLLRFTRGSRLPGLAPPRSIGIISDNLVQIRPLICFRKAELRDLCKEINLQWIEDPSNNNAKFDRIRVRQTLQELDTTSYKDNAAANNNQFNSHLCAEAISILDEVGQQLFHSLKQLKETHVTLPSALHAEVQIAALFAENVPIPLITALFQSVIADLTHSYSLDNSSGVEAVVLSLKNSVPWHRDKQQISGCLLQKKFDQGNAQKLLSVAIKPHIKVSSDNKFYSN